MIAFRTALLILSIAGAATVAQSSTNNLTPSQWLAGQETTILLRISSDRAPKDLPRHWSGCFRASVLRALLDAGKTVLLPREYLEAEADRMDEFIKDWPGAKIATALRTSATNGLIMWDEIAPNAARIGAKPWDIPPSDQARIRIVGPTDEQVPRLDIAETWTAKEYFLQQKNPIIALPAGSHGTPTKVWNLSAILQGKRGGQIMFEKTYPLAEWASSYDTSDSPAAHTTTLVVTDLIGSKLETP